ncbi:MAG: rod shape-determining protein MreC [Christensenellaceae bacterium]|nr:rod shape-determining protein MreC [Christensenellaceae bacterium]
MKNGFFRNKPVLITLIALTVLLALILASSGDRTVTWLESAVGTVFTPIRSFAARASNGISYFFRDLFNTTDADLENARLKSELALYEQTKLELEELKLEYERLSRMLNYAETLGDNEYVTARVIGKSTGVWFDVFTLNVGSNKGVDLDMPVICADGLVGRVTEVGATWCKITAIIDSGATVPVMVERTRDNCMVRGVLDTSTKDDYIELYYLPSDRTDLVPGDEIITSGIGGIYPKGIRVGTVTEVLPTGDFDDMVAVITPSVDFRHIEEVMIIVGQNSSTDEGN